MRTSMVREHTVRLSNGDTLTAAPYEECDLEDVAAAVAWFNALRPSWMLPLVMTVTATRPIAWMR